MAQSNSSILPLFQWTDPRPDFETQRQEWEASWEHDFKRNYEPASRVPQSGILSHMVSPQNAAVLNSDHCVLFMGGLSKHLMAAQRALTVMTGERDEFEDEWRGADDARRRTCIEGALRCSMTLQPMCQMETERRLCPESTVNYLASDNGHSYLDLLQSLMLPRSAIISEDVAPIFPPHPVIDRFENLSAYEERTPGYKATARMTRLTRAVFLTRLTKDIFLFFYGRHEELTKPVPPSPMTRLSFRQIMESLAVSPQQAGELRAAYRSMSQAVENKRGFPCNTCGVIPDQEDNQKVYRCMGCRGVGRYIFYCSQGCQRQDWKNGKSYPHKKICGKVLTEEEIMDTPKTQSLYSAEGLVPDPEPQLERSAALKTQVSLLETDMWLDYVLILPEETTGGNAQKRLKVMFDLRRKPQFILHRNRALRNGGRLDVQAMYTLMLGTEGELPVTPFDPGPIPPEVIRGQLEYEFGVSISSSPLSVQELHELSKTATPEELALIDRMLVKMMGEERVGPMKRLLKMASPTPYLITL